MFFNNQNNAENQNNKNVVVITSDCDRKEITEQLRQDHAVIINTNKVNGMDRLRLNEYLTGFCDCLGGAYTKITHEIMMATPASYDIANLQVSDRVNQVKPEETNKPEQDNEDDINK